MRRCPQGMPMAENPENRQYWYALRVTYGREMLVKGLSLIHISEPTRPY